MKINRILTPCKKDDIPTASSFIRASLQTAAAVNFYSI